MAANLGYEAAYQRAFQAALGNQGLTYSAPAPSVQRSRVDNEVFNSAVNERAHSYQMPNFNNQEEEDDAAYEVSSQFDPTSHGCAAWCVAAKKELAKCRLWFLLSDVLCSGLYEHWDMIA